LYPDIFTTAFFLTAFAMAIGEWLTYHIFVATKVDYGDIWRFLADLLFPALIFCLLFVPSLKHETQSVDKTVLVAASLMAFYFFLGVPYFFLLRRDLLIYRNGCCM
jgi:hypothetical protein